jgi:hypothetical protein
VVKLPLGKEHIKGIIAGLDVLERRKIYAPSGFEYPMVQPASYAVSSEMK